MLRGQFVGRRNCGLLRAREGFCLLRAEPGALGMGLLSIRDSGEGSVLGFRV